MSSISCLGSCGKNSGRKRGSEKKSLWVLVTQRKAVENVTEGYIHNTAMSLAHNFDQLMPLTF